MLSRRFSTIGIAWFKRNEQVELKPGRVDFFVGQSRVGRTFVGRRDDGRHDAEVTHVVRSGAGKETCFNHFLGRRLLWLISTTNTLKILIGSFKQPIYSSISLTAGIQTHATADSNTLLAFSLSQDNKKETCVFLVQINALRLHRR